MKRRQRGWCAALVALGFVLTPAVGLGGGDKPPAAAAQAPQFEHEMPKKSRRDWVQGWTHARAYTFNFENFRGQLYAWRDGEWHPDLESSHELSPAQAALAYELVHRTRGEVSVSKCALPRHAVVFFDADDEPIASVNVCFECGDILVWPPYYGDEDDAAVQKYELLASKKKGKKKKQADDEDENELLIYAVYKEAMVHWTELFTALGVPLTR